MSLLAAVKIHTIGLFCYFVITLVLFRPDLSGADLFGEVVHIA